MKIKIKLNGHKKSFDIKPNTLLLNLVRDDLHLTGTKYGCGIGECGACTLHLDGEPVLACMMLAVDADNRSVDTIEGVAERGKLHPIQESFIEEGAIQCGFCTPGFIMTIKALLEENPNPTEIEIRDYLRGNLCRCTGYVNIIKAVQKASEKMRN